MQVVTICILLSLAQIARNSHLDLRDILARAPRKDGGWIFPLDNSKASNGGIQSGSEDGMPFRERGLLQRRSGALGIEGSVRETGWVAERCMGGDVDKGALPME